MTRRYLVVDQNVLRRPPLEERLAAEPRTHFVLPDLAFLEMTKSDQWESTLHGSLRMLSEYANRVHVCRSVNEALGLELASLRSIEGHMLYPEATAFARNILNSVRTGVDGHALGRIRADPDSHRQALAQDHLNHEQNKARFKELIDSTKRLLPDELQRRMRGAKVPDSERLQIIYDMAVSLLPQILGERGISIEKSRAFMKRKPMVLRYLYAKAWYCVSWIQKGGFESFRPDDVTNDEIDQQYVLSATFFHGLLSMETRVNDCYSDLLLLLAKKGLIRKSTGGPRQAMTRRLS